MASAVALLLLLAGSLSRRRRQPLRAPLSLAYAYLEPQARRNIWGRLVFVPTKFCNIVFLEKGMQFVLVLPPFYDIDCF